ncbi:hypothetical protein [Streptomyces xanthophaeus]|uniref:hypothetical protein n=1 Tax=Streptomyces xanthophaeus TaxID=67385 RepID=UPI0004CCED91|nr:hypothetical protein [Streptomyces xanthophaeus]
MSTYYGSSARRLMIAALIPLAADAAAQQAWLKSFPIATDDLLYDFDNALPVFAREEADEIDAAAVMEELRTIEDHFREMCGDRPADPWTYEALAKDPAWAAVRALAREILFVLTGDRTLPMPHINFIPAAIDTATPPPVDHLAP